MNLLNHQQIEVPVESPSLKRSTRIRRPALELDPTSGRWIPKRSISSLGWGNKLGGGEYRIMPRVCIYHLGVIIMTSLLLLSCHVLLLHCLIQFSSAVKRNLLY